MISPLPRRNLQSFIATMRARGNAGGFARAGAVRREELSCAGTLALAGAAARALRDAGIRTGERVVVQMEDGPSWVAGFLGALAAGAVVVPLDAGSDEARLRSVAAHCEARAILHAGAGAARSFEGRRIDLGDPDVARGADAAALEPLADPEPGDLAEIIFTSGTTAEPRGVMITHGNVLAALAGIEAGIDKRRRLLGLFSPITILSLVPLSHMFGQALGLFIPAILGARVVYSASRPPRALFDLARREKAWVMVAVPRHLAGLRPHVEALVPERPRGSRWWARALGTRPLVREHGWRLRTFVVGGARLDPDLERFYKDRGYLVVQGYGLTETAPIVSVSNPFDDRVGLVGKPGRSQEVRIAPDGEILIRGGNVTSGYFHDEAATREALRDGWLHTGDFGAIDPDGSLRISGRKKEVIVTGEGQNVFPEEVEAELARQEAIAEAAVVARPGARGEEVHAAVIPERGASAEDVAVAVAAANAALEAHQRVRGWRPWKGADFPRTPTGKLIRRAVAAAMEERAPSSAGAEAAADPLALLRSFAGAEARADQRLGSDLGLSSIDVAELTSELEERCQVQIDPALLHDDASLQDLVGKAFEPGRAASWPMPRWSSRPLARAARAALQALIVFPGLALFTRRRVSGAEHLAGLAPPFLIAANHTSHLDVPLLLASLPRHLRRRVAVAMQPEYFEPYLKGEGSLARRLHLGWHYRLVSLLLHTFPFPRSAAFRVAMEYAGELADQGFSILVFPEGVLTRDGSMAPFRPGVGVLARELKLKLLPARIDGAFDVLPVGRWIPKRLRGPVRVTCGAPLAIGTSETPGAFAERVEAAVRRMSSGESVSVT